MSGFPWEYVEAVAISNHGVKIAGKTVKRFVLISCVFGGHGGQIHGYFDHFVVVATSLQVDGDGSEKQLGHATLKVTRLWYS